MRLAHAETFSDKLRDFRWLIEAPEGGCSWPWIPIPQKKKETRLNHLLRHNLTYDMAICAQPIFWHSFELKEKKTESDGSKVFVGSPPAVKNKGHWVGYYLKLEFEGDTPQHGITIFDNDYHLTTKGWTYPNTLPYADCHGAGCEGKMV